MRSSKQIGYAIADAFDPVHWLIVLGLIEVVMKIWR